MKFPTWYHMISMSIYIYQSLSYVSIYIYIYITSKKETQATSAVASSPRQNPKTNFNTRILQEMAYWTLSKRRFPRLCTPHFPLLNRWKPRGTHTHTSTDILPPCKTGTGKLGEGIDVNHRRYLRNNTGKPPIQWGYTTEHPRNFNMETQKMKVWKMFFPFQNGWFLGFMLVFRGCRCFWGNSVS